MLSFKFIIATLCAAASTYAASNDSTPPFEITNLEIRKVASANITISFTIHDPDPLGNATAICSASWEPKSQGYPQGPYKPCGNSTFAWHMESYNNAKSFSLGVLHRYTDPAVGEPPYDQITNFGNTAVAKPVILCKATSGMQVCEQDKAKLIKVPITETMAKRR